MFDDLLKDLYFNLKNETAYTSKKNLYKKAKSINKNVTLKHVDKFYKQFLVTTLHKPVRRKFLRVKTFVKSPGHQIQVDLCDMRNIAEYNEGFNYLLTGVDCFSRFGYAEKLKNKSGKQVSIALQNILAKSPFQRLQVDKGREFLNKNVKQLLKNANTELWVSENDDIKAALVERYNRTLKNSMYKYFTAKNTFKWIDVIFKIVDGYNSTKHSATGFIPKNVTTPLIYLKIRRKLYGKTPSKTLYKYELKSYVRISNARRVFQKGYNYGWSEEVFQIFHRKKIGGQNLYALKDLAGEKVAGFFYEPEIQLIKKPAIFRIDKILKKTKAKKKTQYFVSWKGFPKKFNSWIDESQLNNA